MKNNLPASRHEHGYWNHRAAKMKIGSHDQCDNWSEMQCLIQAMEKQKMVARREMKTFKIWRIK